jgi:hypothetical protein
MDSRAYERVTNVCFLVAVLAALLFDRVSSLKWLIGGLGILAGIAASSVYFLNQRRASLLNRSKESVELKGAVSLKPRAVKLSKVFLTERGIQLYESDAEKERHDYLWRTRILEYKRNVRLHGYPEDIRWKAMSPPHEPSRFVESVVEIVQRLCGDVDRPSFEFTIATDGSFTIRSLKNPTPRASVQSTISEEGIAVKGTEMSSKPN